MQTKFPKGAIAAAVFALLSYLFHWYAEQGGKIPNIPPTSPPPQDTSIVTPTPPITSPPTTDNSRFVGTNCFLWTPPDNLKPFKSLRVFISNSFIMTDKGLFVEPIFRARTAEGKGLDSWLQNTTANDQEVILCLNQTPPQFWNLTSSAFFDDHYNPHKSLIQFCGGEMSLSSLDLDHPPVKVGADRKNPSSYSWYASMMAQIAMRYGSKKVDDAVLKVDATPRWTNDPPNQKKSGLKCKIYIEPWNELDKWWKKGDGSGVYMEPEEWAAFHSACYDAIKDVDPNIGVVCAGLTGWDFDYINRAIKWFETNRKDKKWPSGMILNVHHYSNAGNQYKKWPPTWFTDRAVRPQDDLNFKSVHEFVQIARKLNVELWVSEFGYDTKSPSWMYPTPQPNKTSEQVQAEWLVETYQAYKNAGVSRCFMFNANDEPGADNGGLYQSSGLLRSESKNFDPKPSYKAVVDLIGR